MGRKKTSNKYTTIKIPNGTTEIIDKLIEKEKFTSRTDVIKYAIRTYSYNITKGRIK